MAYVFQIEAQLSPKNARFPLILFSDSNNPGQVLLFLRSYKPRKNSSVLGGTANRNPTFPYHRQMRRTYAQ